MSRFIVEKFRDFDAYVPGEQPRDKTYIKLNTNESPYPPSPQVTAAINRKAVADLRLYPDPECTQLRRKLADAYGVESENVFVANGSDDILNFAFQLFACGRKAYFPDISYGFYPVYAKLHNVAGTQIPLREDFTIRISDYCGLDGMVVLANPNAPTGIALSRDELERVVAENPNQVVLIDEAYVDFGAQSCVPLVKKYDNLLVVQTYSKSRSLAGGRLGFAIGQKHLIDDLNLLKYSTNPYSINRLTLIAGSASIDSNAYYRENCARIVMTREHVKRSLVQMGFTVTDSMANFVFAKKEGVEGETVYRILRENGVLVRHFSSPRIRDYNRISIGTRSEMDEMLRILREKL